MCFAINLCILHEENLSFIEIWGNVMTGDVIWNKTVLHAAFFVPLIPPPRFGALMTQRLDRAKTLTVFCITIAYATYSCPVLFWTVSEALPWPQRLPAFVLTGHRFLPAVKYNSTCVTSASQWLKSRLIFFSGIFCVCFCTSLNLN